jgi:hypothetical protein
VITYTRLSIQAIEQDFAAAFEPGVDRITRLIQQRASADGSLNLSGGAKDLFIDAIGDEVSALFTPRGSRNAFGRDGVTAQAPFPVTLNRWYANAVYRAVKPHADWMTKRVPLDIQRALKSRVQVRRESYSPIGETTNPIKGLFVPNPLAQYDPMHTWVDPNGYVLSQRIWRAGEATRSKIDRLLADLIARGTGSLEMSRILEQFLLPGRELLRTRKPYGTDASYDAMRLARTEIAHAANQAAAIAAYSNPYVETIDVARSRWGDPNCKICPQHATIGINGERIRPAYPKSSFRIPPFHSHCQCRLQANVGDFDEVNRRLREWSDMENPPPLDFPTPLDWSSLLLLLLGAYLYSQIEFN